MKKKTREVKKDKPTAFKNFLDKKFLLIVVFITGACVLVIEVVATRILSPYFGNTIFSVSSILGVVLGALSFGYYLGGKYADSNPSLKNFYSIIYYSGIATLILEFLSLFAFPRFAYALPPISGSLIASLILFSAPSFLLGMLSPYVIKLQEIQNPKAGIGKLSGEVFFASTLGSIFGSLTTGFFLIPNFGINAIVSGVGILLIALGIGGIYLPDVKKKPVKINKGFIFKVFIGLFLISVNSSSKQFATRKVIYEDDGIYSKIIVYDTRYMGKPARLLAQDAGISSGIYIDSEELTFMYTKYYSLYKVFDVDVKNALFLGGGAYSTPHKLVNELPESKVDVVEIEPSLYDVAKKYFRVTDNGRLTNIIADGRRYLYDTDKRYDLIFSDAYSSIYSIPIHMTTQEFFKIAYDKLNENGMFVANIIGDLERSEDSLIFSEMKTFKDVFDSSYFFAVEDPALTTPQNIIFVGLKKNIKTDFTKDEYTKSDNELFKNLSQKRIDINRFDLDSYTTISDNYAPIETLSSQVLKKQIRFIKRKLNSEDMYGFVKQQYNAGPRFPGSEGHQRTIDMIVSELHAVTDEVITQPWKENGIKENLNLTNIIGRINPDSKERIILATHFDTKKYANKDKNNKNLSVGGANDGASGTAVLLEIARYIKFFGNSGKGYDFVFFDGEEGDPEISDRDWKPLGSNYFSNNLGSLYSDKLPKLAIVLDMVCDRNLDIYKENNSSVYGAAYVHDFFKKASATYPDNFHKDIKMSVEDDHIALAKAGIPSFLLIDFEYPYFHTTQDTPDKCSKESLEKVGKVVLDYVNSL